MPVGVRLDDRVRGDARPRPARGSPQGSSASASRSSSSQAVRGNGGRPAVASHSAMEGRGAAASRGRGRVRAGLRAGCRLARAEPKAPVRAPALVERGEALARHRQRVGQVRGEDPGIAEPVARRIAGAAVEVDARAGPPRTARAPGPGARRWRPASTSPVPPVASPGFSNGATATEPSGAAITVRAPLRTTTWPHRPPRPARPPPARRRRR